MREATQESYQDRVRRVVAHVHRHLDHELDPAALARVACFSRHHFSRMFRGMVGEPPLDFVRRLRLERAARRLEASADVTTVAIDAGYGTPEAFARAFKSRFGRPPSQWRAADPSPCFPPVSCRFHYGSPLSALHFPAHEESPMDVQVAYRAALRVACKRHTGPYSGLRPAFEAAARYCGEKGLFGMHTQAVGIYWDDPDSVPEEQLRSAGGFVVMPGFEGDAEAGIDVQDLAAGDYAILTHLGPYEKLPESYARLLGQWLPSSARTPADHPCYEIYVSDPQTTPADELITKIHLLLCPES